MASTKYDYDPATGSYARSKPPPDDKHSSSSSSAPPPRPPKELPADHDHHHRRNYVHSPITKETQSGLTELEGDSLDMASLSMEDTASRKNPSEGGGGGEVVGEKKRSDKDRSRPLDQPRSRSRGRSKSRSRRRKVRILSLDGGGIRGYSTLVILSELMHQVYVQTHGCAPRSPSELPRPCDYFDLIGGTGTGGLIALMLGRMRMDIESCKEYYVELTRFVFITDKTLMGVPYGKTLFKASRLEDAIRHVVRQSTRFESEKIIPHSPSGPQRIQSRRSDSWKRRAAAAAAFGSPIRTRTRSNSPPRGRSGGGNAEAPLFDDRKGRCRTFVTATYIGSAPGTPPVLLRTYPSPTESVPSYNCTIWQAGRATSATLAAFKPIAIGQNIFLDEGAGQYNPAVAVLEEARRNEFPDCDTGVFISIGTGKRPDVPSSSSSSDPKNRHHHRHHRSTDTVDKPLWWEGVISTPSFDSFAAARHRLLSKIDDSERIHRYLLDGPDSGDGQPGLTKLGVSRENYYRFNVEVGVGEFAMNEWNRLAEVSTSTRRYLVMRETTKFVREAAGKLVDIEKETVSRGEKVGFEASRSDCEISELPAVVTPPPAASAPQWQQQQLPASPPTSTGGRGRNPTTIPILTEKIPVSPPTPSSPPPPPPPQIQYSSYDPTGRAGGAEDIYPNPEIRITSPTTVAGGSERGSFSDDNTDDGGRRRRRRDEGEGEIERRRRKRREKAAAAAAAAAAAGGGGGSSGSGGRRRR